MKIFIKTITMIVMVFVLATSVAQTPSNKELELEFKTTHSALQKHYKVLEEHVNSRAVRDARKAAKSFEKEGFASASGAQVLANQIEQSWKYQLEVDEDGYPLYIVSNQKTIGATYNAAKAKATAQCKVDIAGLISTEIESLIECQLSNKVISSDDAQTLITMVQSSRHKIQQSLGRTTPVLEIFRTMPNGNVEVQMTMAYNTTRALEQAKEIVRADINSTTSGEGERLSTQFEKVFF